MNITYNLNIPAGPNNPSNDQPLMEVNTNSINTWVGIDHRGFNTSDNSGGWHTLIHQQNQTVGGQSAWNPVIGSGVPAAIQATKIAGVQQTFPMNYTPDTTGGVADTQLFTMTGDGGIAQLTGNFATIEGYTWSAGLLFQWGKISSIVPVLGAISGSVSFKDRNGTPSTIPFPNNCFNVQLTFFINGGTISASSGDVNFVTVKSFNTTTFNYSGIFKSSIGGGGSLNLLWMAIGN